MGLLHNSNIQELVNGQIKGRIARVGGRMNQLIDYKNSKVTDINIIDGGYGKVRNKFNIKSIKNFIDTNKRQLRQEIVWLLHGECEMRDRKTNILDMHFAYSKPELQHKFDAVISSNVIEHSPNPIWFLLNLHFITNEKGYQYHAIPHHKLIFDRFRQPTSLEHIIEDFECMKWFDDLTHNADYTMSAIEKDGHQRTFHESYPVTYPFMHFHVFDEDNTLQLIEYMFEDVVVDCLKTEKYNDIIVIFKNKLRPTFKDKYKTHIEKFVKFVDNYNADSHA
ncbi:MAG: hypothetical protein WCG93_04070 [Paludibacter sp.]